MALICKYCLCEQHWSGDIIEIEGNVVKTEPPPLWMIEGELPLLPSSLNVCSCPCHWRNSSFYFEKYLAAVREIYGGKLNG